MKSYRKEAPKKLVLSFSFSHRIISEFFSSPRFHLKLDPDHEVMRMPLATFKTENGMKLIAKMRKSTGGNM